MKKVFSLLFTALFATTLCYSQNIKKVKIKDVLKMADTSTIPLVINFFATWCRPCVQELPWFEHTVPNYKEKGVKLVLVSLDYNDDYPNTILSFAKKNAINSNIVWLDEADPNYFCSIIDKTWQGTIPVTLMVNNKKHYRKFYDHQLPEGQLKTALNKLIE